MPGAPGVPGLPLLPPAVLRWSQGDPAPLRLLRSAGANTPKNFIVALDMGSINSANFKGTFQGIEDLLARGGSKKVLPVIPQLIIPIKCESKPVAG